MDDTMRAVEITEAGGPEVLQLCERPAPQLGADEVLIKVAYAGVNRPDAMQRQGLYPPPKGASDIPGLEVSGTIEAIGDAVTRWDVGEKVCALLTGGGYADYATAHEQCVLPVPDGLSMEEAAAVPETFFTVWTNLFDRTDLRDGSILLVHGGTSGIGTTAIQLAKAFGARVFATAGSPEKCVACREIGAEGAFNYRETDFVEAVKEATDGYGADVILDMIGGDYLARNMQVAAKRGRIVSIATQRGAKAEMDIFLMMRKRLTLTGSTLRMRAPEEKGEIATALQRYVWPMFADGRVKPVMHGTYPLAEAAAAHAALDADHIGKIVLEVTA